MGELFMDILNEANKKVNYFFEYYDYYVKKRIPIRARSLNGAIKKVTKNIKNGRITASGKVKDVDGTIVAEFNRPTETFKRWSMWQML